MVFLRAVVLMLLLVFEFVNELIAEIKNYFTNAFQTWVDER